MVKQNKTKDNYINKKYDFSRIILILIKYSKNREVIFCKRITF